MKRKNYNAILSALKNEAREDFENTIKELGGSYTFCTNEEYQDDDFDLDNVTHIYPHYVSGLDKFSSSDAYNTELCVLSIYTDERGKIYAKGVDWEEQQDCEAFVGDLNIYDFALLLDCLDDSLGGDK